MLRGTIQKGLEIVFTTALFIELSHKDAPFIYQSAMKLFFSRKNGRKCVFRVLNMDIYGFSVIERNIGPS